MDAILDERYPIGRFQPGEATLEGRAACVARLGALPAAFRAALSGLSDAQLDTPYREGGWTLRQVAHHVPDSHMNAYIRFKWTLTEEAPRIKPYDEAAWAKLPDTGVTPIEVSLALLESLHSRWVDLMEALTDEQWSRTFEHPETGPWRLDQVVHLYAWHGEHHLAHVTGLRRRMGW
jgi:uncharacterized damage-inducible protein DinB